MLNVKQRNHVQMKTIRITCSNRLSSGKATTFWFRGKHLLLSRKRKRAVSMFSIGDSDDLSFPFRRESEGAYCQPHTADEGTKREQEVAYVNFAKKKRVAETHAISIDRATTRQREKGYAYR